MNCRISTFGMVNALGSDLGAIAARLFNGDQSRLSRRSDFIPAREVWVAAVIEELPALNSSHARYASRTASIAQAVYRQIETAVLEAVSQFGADRIGVVIGSSTSGIEVGEKAVQHLRKSGAFPADYAYTRQEPGAISAFISELSGAQGPSYSISTACSSSAKVFSSGKRLLEGGVCDAVIVGGVDSLCQLTLNGFAALELISDGICNPLGKARSGITIGEGGALALLTKEPGGIQLLGVGESSDAYHISAPEPEGAGVELAMRRALADSGLSPADISYINLHGTGTVQNDSMESRAVARIFPDTVYCSSTKPLVGHTLGAAGAIEAGCCWLSLSHSGPQIPLPPHIVRGELDDSLPPLRLAPVGSLLDVRGLAAFLSNSFAFGGNNCSVILGKVFE